VAMAVPVVTVVAVVASTLMVGPRQCVPPRNRRGRMHSHTYLLIINVVIYMYNIYSNDESILGRAASIVCSPTDTDMSRQ